LNYGLKYSSTRKLRPQMIKQGSEKNTR
jgi:hypothetical protein